MIITNKQFPNYRKYEMMYEGRPLSMEVGKMAELCNAAVLVKYGETTVLVTCTASARPKDGIDAVRASPACPPCWPPASSTGPCAPSSPPTCAMTLSSPARS